jgi:hypothetical protein
MRKSTTLLFSGLMGLASIAFAGGDAAKVSIKGDGKNLKDLSESLYIKPGTFKKAPQIDIKRGEISVLDITTPTEGLEATDSLRIEVKALAGKVVIWSQKTNVIAGGSTMVDIKAAMHKDFSPNAKQPTMAGRFEIEVTPLLRANSKGIYKGAIAIK